MQKGKPKQRPKAIFNKIKERKEAIRMRRNHSKENPTKKYITQVKKND